MPIRYKVVKERNGERFSVVVSNLKFRLRYPRHATIKAPDHTLGIMCFETRKQARSFASINSANLILKVQGIGRGYKPKLVLWWISEISDFANLIKLTGIKKAIATLEAERKAPTGTICYKKIRVLD